MTFPRYEKYKDSGVEWLGEVPAHWDVNRLKHNLRLLTEKTERRENPVALENIEGWTGRFIPTETEFQGDGVAFEIGDILFGKLRPYLAKAYRAERSGEAVGDFHVMRPAGIDSRFAQYQVLSREFIAMVDGSTFGSKMPRASWEFVGGMGVAVPPLCEQSAIVDFLDRETSKIDALVTEQQRLMELLKEKRQAVISHAVTKGLDPNAKMKDSGIEWLGEVPAHWNVSKVKHHCSINGRIGFRGYTTADQVDEGEGALVLGATHITSSGAINLDQPVYLSWDKYYESPEIVVSQSDILVVQRGSTCGKIGFLDADYGRATINPSLVLLKGMTCFPRLMFFYLSSSLVQGLLECVLGSTAIPMLSQEQIGDIALCLPPTDEQKRIVGFIGQQLAQLDALIAEAQRAIDLLQERRTALISAAVTGQIDVRGVV